MFNSVQLHDGRELYARFKLSTEQRHMRERKVVNLQAEHHVSHAQDDGHFHLQRVQKHELVLRVVPAVVFMFNCMG